jgi:hypothetical protein
MVAMDEGTKSALWVLVFLAAALAVLYVGGFLDIGSSPLSNYDYESNVTAVSGSSAQITVFESEKAHEYSCESKGSFLNQPIYLYQTFRNINVDVDGQPWLSNAPYSSSGSVTVESLIGAQASNGCFAWSATAPACPCNGMSDPATAACAGAKDANVPALRLTLIGLSAGEHNVTIKANLLSDSRAVNPLSSAELNDECARPNAVPGITFHNEVVIPGNGGAQLEPVNPTPTPNGGIGLLGGDVTAQLGNAGNSFWDGISAFLNGLLCFMRIRTVC